MAQESSTNATPVPFRVSYAPTDQTIYPESDGEPMAETDIHRKLMTELIEVIENHFRSRHDVYVSGNLLLYYEEGNTKKSVAPDVFVVFGAKKKLRRTYLLWEEKKSPNFIIELVSKTTFRNDLNKKKKLYANVLSVDEYFLYDPIGSYLQPALLGFRLVNGVYLPIQPAEVGLPSRQLGLELCIKNNHLRFYDPLTKEWVLKPAEQSEARARKAESKARHEYFARQKESLARQQAEAIAKRAESEAQQESLARQKAEAELAKLQAELGRLR